MLGAMANDSTQTVTTADGAQTLLVGGLMGSTKQRYARVPGPNKDVFLLGADASTRLFRDLKAFTR